MEMKTSTTQLTKAMERLLMTVQQLSLTRDLESIIAIVRKEARQLTGADGATFVLRDNGFCYYVDEDAIAPLWKGKRFPMETCISGWVMLNHKTAIIEDIYEDPRIPADAYRPTFVKSLAMVPIRTESPIGAIGNYWSKKYKPSQDEIKLLQALADSTSIAMENVQLYSDLEKRLHEKELLLKEIYHRVKNNLQIISSLLKLQAKTVKESHTQEALRESIARIQSMALVHEILYQSDNLASISMKIYLDRLFKYLNEIYSNVNRIRFVNEIDDISFKIDIAIPCGLIINELLSNAFKHAFPANQSGEVNVSLKKDGDSAIFTIKDNGIGLSEHINLDQASTLGLRLVNNLTKQINGKIILQRHQGTCFTLTFIYNGEE